MFEQQLHNFFKKVGPSLHANNILQELNNIHPIIKRNPQIALPEIYRFRHYLTDAPLHNVEPALKCLLILAVEVPELRDQIIKDIGDVLYEYKEFKNVSYEQILKELLRVLEIPVSKKDQHIRDLARSIVSLNRPIIVVIGAGFSYDTMPITSELKPLLVKVLRFAGIEKPMDIIEKDVQQVWRVAKKPENDFKKMFTGWCTRSTPSFQHSIVCKLLRTGKVSHLISFNWDDLCERAYEEQFNDSIPKVISDKVMPDRPALWKLHGDVENLDDEWVFPDEPGRVFNSLIESLNQTIEVNPPSHALIVGYSEFEPEVRERLISWLEENVPMVIRVRPNWPEQKDTGIPDSAKRFFQRLKAYMIIEDKNKSIP